MACAGENLYNKIDTFVFFDLETTDFIKGTKMPKITELSMVATDRNSIRSDSRNKLALPRIIHKLTIPICPNQPIHPQASYVSNLWNDTLENIKPFDESTYNMIMQFLERLPGLVCFVAHNGNRFDYPIFLSEIHQIKKTFPDRILCVDTLPAFQEFFSDELPVVESPIQAIPAGYDEVDEEELLNLRKQDSNISLDDNWNDALSTVLDDFEITKGKTTQRTCLTSDGGKDVLDAISNKKSSNSNSTGSSPKKSPTTMQAINEKTPENQIIRNSHSPRKILNGARKQLNFNDSKPKNFKLCTVYQHMIGYEAENQHVAEGDCISMLRCVCQIGSHFAEWADINAVSLNFLKK